MDNKVLILDFGGQYCQLIARRVREAKIYCEIVPYSISKEEIIKRGASAIIFSGGPNSVYWDKAPYCDDSIYEMGLPILGICYGGQLIAKHFGGVVEGAEDREYGKVELLVQEREALFENVVPKSLSWMSHTDLIKDVPEGFRVLAKTESCPVAAMKHENLDLYAVQFHPEVEHSEEGRKIINNFLLNVAKLEQNWDMGDFAEQSIQNIKDTIKDGKAICALSGGVDSSVAALLVHKAIGKNLTCVFVDHGLLRKDEGNQVEEIFRNRFDMNLIRVNAQERFLGKLKGVTDPETKRKIIGEEFIRVFEEEKAKLLDKEGHIDYLVQGTIYPDVIESGTDKASVIKSHHNVGGLPEDVDFKLLEPLNQLFKDEVREVGRKIGLDEDLVSRQPFPGPGLAIRCLGEITEGKLEIIREADFIFRDEIKKAGLDKEIWQYFAALPNLRSVGVMGDERTYDHAIVLRAVTSTDGMTSDWARIPLEVLDKISRNIVNQVKGVNRVMYDITSKPPSTIEYE